MVAVRVRVAEIRHQRVDNEQPRADAPALPHQEFNIIRKNRETLHAPLTEMDLPPYGRVRTFAVRSPDGVWLEFLQLLAPPAG